LCLRGKLGRERRDVGGRMCGKGQEDGEFRKIQEEVVQVKKKLKQIKNMLEVWSQLMWYGPMLLI
jgi:hypothetical protein